MPGVNDQRSTTDQLRDAVHILNQHGLYDAADHCRREVERVDAKLRATMAAVNTITPERAAEMAARYRAQAVGCRELAEEFERNADRWELLAAATDEASMIEARRVAGFIT